MSEDRVIAKLIADTQAGKLVWEKSAGRDIKGGPEDIDYVYVCNWGTYRIGLICYTYQGYIADFDTYYPVNEAMLVLLDADETISYTFPTRNGLNDLFTAIQFQTAGVKNFLTDFLASQQ